MPVATGTIGLCERTYSELETQLDSTLEKFLAALESGQQFGRFMDRMESQLALARRMQSAQNDLELNETAVLADKLELELAAASERAAAAVVCSSQEKWSEELEKAKGELDSMGATIRKMKTHGWGDGAALEARSSFFYFQKNAALCRQRLRKLKCLLAKAGGRPHARVERARLLVKKMRAGVGAAFQRITRQRLGKRIAEAKAEISGFLHRAKCGRISVDCKHLTLRADGRMERIPLTQSVRFALAEIAPIEKSLAKVEKGGALLLGSYEREGKSTVLRVGERSAVGDSVVYREREYRLPG